MAATRTALIVAAYEFDDPKFQQLRAPAKDAQALADVLADPRIGGFEVQTLINEPSGRVNQEIEGFFSDRTPDDLLLLYFTCHGVKDPNGRLYFAMGNTKFPFLRSTGVPASFVSEQMESSRARRIALLLDCCYSGAFLKGLRARASEEVHVSEQFEGRGRAVITASRATEYAFEADELTADKAKPSIFTSAIVQGLVTGSADRDENGLVTIDELYDYVYDEVKGKVAGQTPGRWVDVEGDLVIARNPSPPVRPAELPVELQNAIHSESALQRLGAVSVLRMWRDEGSEGEALRATEVLESLAEDPDIRVNAAARSALGRTATPTAPPEQHPPVSLQPPEPQPPPSPPEEERPPPPPAGVQVDDVGTAPPKLPRSEPPVPLPAPRPLASDRKSRRLRTAGWLGMLGAGALLLADVLPYSGEESDRYIYAGQRLGNIFIAVVVGAASAELLRSHRRGTAAGWVVVGTAPTMLSVVLSSWAPFFQTDSYNISPDSGFLALATGCVAILIAGLVAGSAADRTITPRYSGQSQGPLLAVLGVFGTALAASAGALIFRYDFDLGVGTNFFVVAVMLVGFVGAWPGRHGTPASGTHAGRGRRALAVGTLYALATIVYLVVAPEGDDFRVALLPRASLCVGAVGTSLLLAFAARFLTRRQSALAIAGLAATAAASLVDPMIDAADFGGGLPRTVMLTTLVAALALAAWLWRSEPVRAEPIAADQ